MEPFFTEILGTPLVVFEDQKVTFTLNQHAILPKVFLIVLDAMAREVKSYRILGKADP